LGTDLEKYFPKNRKARGLNRHGADNRRTIRAGQRSDSRGSHRV
jgi:hypothetical protein